MLNHSTKTISIATIIVALCLCLSAFSSADFITDSIGKALDESDVGLDLRYRYEFVDQDGKPENARASTLRSRITMKSGVVGGFHGLIEVDNVGYLGGDTFNNIENGKTNYPVVADPDYTEVNQVLISYVFGEKNKTTLGRQRINHSRQRFIGSVAWRQNEQTFDAARMKLFPMDGLTLDYSYIWRVNRVFGPNGADGEFSGDNHALIASYKIADEHTLSVYNYTLDLDEAAALSSRTYGLEYKGLVRLGEVASLGIQLAAAKQNEHNDNPAEFSADYYFGELTTKFKPASIVVGHEVLGTDNGTSFKSPLGTLHKFQGFADQFLATPVNGIKDSYLKVITKAGGIKLIVFYHDFEAEAGSMSYGTELDFIATYTFSKYYSVLFKYAAYDADDLGSDTRKAWLMLTARF